MKAVRLDAVGELFLKEVERPKPGPGDLLVRVEASGICGTDRHLLKGEFPSKPPVTLGHEFCGIVEEIGPGVQGFRTGMRVTGDPNIVCGRCVHCQNGRINLCRNLTAIGIHRDGGLADYVIVPQQQAYELPLSLKASHGAFCEPIACCLHGIDIADIQPGSSVIVLGGGVIGLITVQLARLAGASRVVLSTRALVLGVTVFTSVTLAQHGNTVPERFREAIVQLEEVQECFSVAGEADYLLRLVVPDLPALSEFITHKLMRVPGVGSVRSNIVLMSFKSDGAMPLSHLRR